MPALDEERHIGEAIESVLPAAEDIACEVLVLDGGSTDRTREIVASYAARDPRIRLLTNPRRIQSAAVNIAAELAHPRSRVLVRADCHSRYPQGFARRAVARLAETGAASVVVPMRTVGRTCLQSAIAAAQNSRLGNGGARHRTCDHSGFVDHGHHAAFDRDIFLAVGGYDETFAVNEDAELDSRLTRSGHRIYLDGALAIDYLPRATLAGLARQYRAYGQGRMRTLVTHRLRPRLRQVLPLVAAGVSLAGIVLAPVHPVTLAAPVGYIAGTLAWGLALAVRHRRPCESLSGVAALVMHMSWAWGAATFLAGLRGAQPARGRDPGAKDAATAEPPR
ncbi:MAG: glycosyltransferase family 2 protein [Hyphomicrobiaceae bacterium]|nr:glycosyltransferase family 2 protein [Hyphomicrobiaceae bacterium]